MDIPKACPSCGSERIAAGRISAQDWAASFQPDGIRSFQLGVPFLMTRSSVHVEKAHACVDCGHIWLRVPPQQLQAVIEKWGKDELRNRLLGPDEIT